VPTEKGGGGRGATIDNLWKEHALLETRRQRLLEMEEIEQRQLAVQRQIKELSRTG